MDAVSCFAARGFSILPSSYRLVASRFKRVPLRALRSHAVMIVPAGGDLLRKGSRALSLERC